MREETKRIARYREALKLAADALDIASDWHVEDVQISVPPWLGVDVTEDANGGETWVMTVALASALRRLAREEL